jgi:predicted RND superfamily exporter protein
MELKEKNSIFQAIVSRYISFLYEKYILILILFVAITVLGIHYVSKLRLKSDFAELLPENYPSVVHMKKIVDRLGGRGSLYIAG